MKKQRGEWEHCWRGMAAVASFSFFLLHLSFSMAQVAPVTGWIATVDSASQQIMLRWHPSADSATLGYHICTGNPCLDYDTVFGRFDTSYVCVDHSPLEQHLYRVHVFDTAYNVSELTPFFGNVVLEAEVPDCETTVSAHWNRYEGYWPDTLLGQPMSYIETRMEPFDTTFILREGYTNSVAGEWSDEIPEAVTRIWLRVMLLSNRGFRAYSNIVMVERRTADTASVVNINAIEYDSVHTCINLSMQVDTAFEYTLYRSIDGTPWRPLHTFQSPQATYIYADCDINPYDSLHCYQLGVKDACGMNPHYSSTAWVVVPDPPKPGIALPNIIVAGDPLNGTFRPVVQGLQGTLYELSIYNRMGLLVYRTDDQDAGWTPPADAPQGAYTYFLRCRYNNNDIKTYSGTVTVIK